MAALSLTYTLTNGTTGDAAQVQQNFTDITNFVNGSVVRIDGTNAMTAALSLVGTDPTNAAHAVQKNYVDGAYAYASGGTSQTFTLNTNVAVHYTAKAFDYVNGAGDTSSSNMSTATGLFTAPKTGVYLVMFRPAFDQSETFLVRQRIGVNATTFYDGPWYKPSAINPVNEIATIPFTLPVRVSSGDTIGGYVNTTATVTRTMNNPTFAVSWMHA